MKGQEVGDEVVSTNCIRSKLRLRWINTIGERKEVKGGGRIFFYRKEEKRFS